MRARASSNEIEESAGAHFEKREDEQEVNVKSSQSVGILGRLRLSFIKKLHF